MLLFQHHGVTRCSYCEVGECYQGQTFLVTCVNTCFMFYQYVVVVVENAELRYSVLAHNDNIYFY